MCYCALFWYLKCIPGTLVPFRSNHHLLQWPSYKLRPLNIIIASLSHRSCSALKFLLCVGLALGLILKNFLYHETKTPKPHKQFWQNLVKRCKNVRPKNKYLQTFLWNHFLNKIWEEEVPEEPPGVPAEDAAGPHQWGGQPHEVISRGEVHPMGPLWPKIA